MFNISTNPLFESVLANLVRANLYFQLALKDWPADTIWVKEFTKDFFRVMEYATENMESIYQEQEDMVDEFVQTGGYDMDEYFVVLPRIEVNEEEGTARFIKGNAVVRYTDLPENTEIISTDTNKYRCTLEEAIDAFVEPDNKKES